MIKTKYICFVYSYRDLFHKILISTIINYKKNKPYKNKILTQLVIEICKIYIS